MMIKLTGGKVYDPANNINGEVRDIYVADGRIIAPAPEARIDKEYDVRGRVVMAGAIDPHTHIGGGKVTIARTLMPEDHEKDEVAHTALTRAGTGHALPSTMITGYRYAEMGYTACFEPAMLPANARQAHMELADTPMLDKGAFVMLGSDDLMLRMISGKTSFEEIKDYIAWTMHAAQAIAVKVVNPGGISAFKFNQRKLDLDEKHVYYGITPRDIILTLARGLLELGRHASAARPRLQPRRAGQRRDDARYHPRHGRPAAAPDAHPVPQLRHRGRPSVLVRRRADRRAPHQVSAHLDRRRPGHVRPDVHGLRRQHAPVQRLQERRPEALGGHGHRVRRRLRRRAVPLSRQELRQRAAVGDRPRDVPLVRGSLAHLPDDGPPERRAVLYLSASHPAAHGPRLPPRDDAAGQPGCTQVFDAADARARILALRDRHPDPRRPRPQPRPQGPRPPRAWRARRHHRLQGRRQPRGDVHDARATCSRTASSSCATAR